jgi:hypothetical protein
MANVPSSDKAVSAARQDAVAEGSARLLKNSIAAALSAIEIYNKPDFKYREQVFSILKRQDCLSDPAPHGQISIVISRGNRKS